VVCHLAEDEAEISSGVRKSSPKSSDRECLARGAADEQVNLSDIPVLVFRHVAQIGHGRVVVSQHRAREGLNLAEGRRLPAHVMPRCGGGFDA
jgi:hypothetical protein